MKSFTNTIIFLLFITAYVLTAFSNDCFKTVYSVPSTYALVPYNGEVINFFTHELIYDTKKAFSYKNPVRNSFDKDHLTSREFYCFLQTMYLNDYILIDYFDMFEKNNDEIYERKQLFLPVGKKPFTLSFDDMTYDTYDLGCVNKLIVNEYGEICDYCDNADIKITNERENIPILESFIKSHPDFSFNNARATICVNGYNGILGYRTQSSNENCEKEREQAKILINALKNKGYSFANHSYYHDYIITMSTEKLAKDLKNWKESVECVVGKTDIFCYPGGIHNANEYRTTMIKNNGYTMFLCVGRDYKKDCEYNDPKYVYIYRMPLDGTALRLYKDFYKDTFDSELIYDHSNRFRTFFYRGGY